MLEIFFLLVVFFGVIVGVLFYFLLKLTEKIAKQSEINREQAEELRMIKEKILLTEDLKNQIEKARDSIESLKLAEEIRKEREKEFLERMRRIDEILAGTFTKGSSGEEILRETFKKLPPEMIETNFQVRGKVVEFALILPNGKRLPIDSKWPASKLLLNLEKETDPEKKKEIVEEIEKEVIKRIKEVKQYIDPDLTWTQAIAAVPDSVYSVCKIAHLKAKEENVILMPYSMVLPLLLYIYRFHLQYAISLDIENLQTHLMGLAKTLDEIENILENKIYKGMTMISNAYFEYKNKIAQIRASLSQFQFREGEKIQRLKP